MTRALTALVGLTALLALACPSSPSWAGEFGPSLSRARTIFAVIERVRGDHLTLRPLHTVMSRDLGIKLFIDDTIRAVLMPSRDGNQRREACVTAIIGRHSRAELVRFQTFEPVPGCLGAVADHRGRAGLPPARISVNAVITIQLNGDMRWTTSTAKGESHEQQG